MRVVFLCLAIAIGNLTVAQKNSSDLNQKVKEFEAYVKKSQQEWELPGLAVTIVKDGKVLSAKGYGVREIGTKNMVDAQTLFACASTTKAMTATCMGILVDEGKVKWENPVIDYFPEFELYDPFVTREIKIRDLFVHDTGVGNSDFLWTMMDIPSDEILKKMRDIKPSYSMRAGYIYQNIFYLAAGKVIEKVSGIPWSEFIQQRIFKPLGMNSTVPFKSMVTNNNQSTPHARIEGKIVGIQNSNADKIGPAGSVWSNVEDMSKWVICMLDSSRYTGGRLLSSKTWMEMFSPQIIIPKERFYASSRLTKPNWTTYGLGWFQHDYKGKKVNFHTGSLAGTIAIHGQLPEYNLGIYVYGNLENGEVRHALMYKAFDLFALDGTLDWSAELLKIYQGFWKQNEKQEKDFETKRVSGTKPSLPLTSYTGKYKDPLYGELVITMNGDSLIAQANNLIKATYSHWHYDTFRGWFEKKWYGKTSMTFAIAADGSISKVTCMGHDFQRAK